MRFPQWYTLRMLIVNVRMCSPGAAPHKGRDYIIMPFINTHTGAPQGEKICLYTPNNKGFIRLPKRPAGAKKIGLY